MLIRVLKVGVIVPALLVASCIRSHEVTERSQQEERFRDAFGFKPPSSIADIKYADRYQRYLLDSVYGQWMCFTCTEDTFDRILKEKGYHEAPRTVIYSHLGDRFQQWWPEVDQNKVTLYIREKAYSATGEGASFREYLWRDKVSGHAYFHKRWGD